MLALKAGEHPKVVAEGSGTHPPQDAMLLIP